MRGFKYTDTCPNVRPASASGDGQQEQQVDRSEEVKGVQPRRESSPKDTPTHNIEVPLPSARISTDKVPSTPPEWVTLILDQLLGLEDRMNSQFAELKDRVKIVEEQVTWIRGNISHKGGQKDDLGTYSNMDWGSWEDAEDRKFPADIGDTGAVEGTPDRGVTEDVQGTVEGMRPIEANVDIGVEGAEAGRVLIDDEADRKSVESIDVVVIMDDLDVVNPAPTPTMSKVAEEEPALKKQRREIKPSKALRSPYVDPRREGGYKRVSHLTHLDRLTRI